MSETNSHPIRCLETKPTSQSVLFCGYFINLSHLSLATGISLSTLSAVFKGTRNPSLKNARKMAEGLGMNIGAFLRVLDKRLELDRAYATPGEPRSAMCATTPPEVASSSK